MANRECVLEPLGGGGPCADCILVPGGRRAGGSFPNATVAVLN